MLCWYILLIAAEAWGAGFLAANYAKYKHEPFYKSLADRILFSYISPWHPLLTPYLFSDQATTVQADIFCTNNVLYQGTVTQHFLNEGKLTGIVLSNPRRFDHELYVAHRAEWDKAPEPRPDKPDKEKYWRTIPSESLYIFADKIFNMNLNFKSPAGQVADLDSVKKIIVATLGELLKNEKFTIKAEGPAHPKIKG